VIGSAAVSRVKVTAYRHGVVSHGWVEDAWLARMGRDATLPNRVAATSTPSATGQPTAIYCSLKIPPNHESAVSTMAVDPDAPPQQPVLVIMGVSGSGKSTVAAILAGQLDWDLQEGDDLHPGTNVDKMAAGIALTDEDRWPWLDRVADWIRDHTAAGVPGIITCSALKRVYRDRMRGEHVVFVHIAGSKDSIGKRLAARTDHYMPTSLLDSQFATLEPPDRDENALEVAIGRKPADEAAEIIRRLDLHPETAVASSAPPLADLRNAATDGGHQDPADHDEHGLLVTLRADLSDEDVDAVAHSLGQVSGVVAVQRYVADPSGRAALELNDSRWRESIVHLLDDEGV
jgi:gluconokinase